MRTQTVLCAHCAKQLVLPHNPDRPPDVVVYCSWKCRAAQLADDLHRLNRRWS